MNNKIDSITNAPTLELTGEQAFLYENNFTGTPTPPSIKISAKVENVVNPTYQWYFRRSGETSWTPIANNNYNNALRSNLLASKDNHRNTFPIHPPRTRHKCRKDIRGCIVQEVRWLSSQLLQFLLLLRQDSLVEVFLLQRK